MARFAGRNGRLYMGASSAAQASPVTFMKQYTIDQASDTYEVTCFEDTTKTYVAGLPDASGSYNGFVDDSAAQMILAAQDGSARRMYWYPNASVNTRYFWGTAFFDTSMDFMVDGAASVSGNWKAATPCTWAGVT